MALFHSKCKMFLSYTEETLVCFLCLHCIAPKLQGSYDLALQTFSTSSSEEGWTVISINQINDIPINGIYMGAVNVSRHSCNLSCHSKPNLYGVTTTFKHVCLQNRLANLDYHKFIFRQTQTWLKKKYSNITHSNNCVLLNVT